MPYDEADETDPMMLIGVDLPGDEASSLESCRVFAEEFARMGFNAEKLMELFRNPFYAGPHAIWRSRGDEYVRGLILCGRERWGFPRFAIKE